MSETRTHRAPERTAVLWSVALLGLLLVGAAFWVGMRGLAAADELGSAKTSASVLQGHLAARDTDAATASTRVLLGHTGRAAGLTGDPIWRAAEYVPFLGPNLVAVRQGAEVVDGMAADVAGPLVPVVGSIDAVVAGGAKVDLAPVAAAAPAVAQARRAVAPLRAAVERIDTAGTLPFVREGIDDLDDLVGSASDAVEALDRAATLLPGMLGSSETRNYLLLVQNNAEVRASGGLAGATAVLTASDGVLTVSNQKATGDYPRLREPILPVSAAEANLYGEVLGRYIGDVNLTPDFSRTAELALAMAEPVYGMALDGVIAIDPYVLERVLVATGPVPVGGGVVLDEASVVRVLLSDVYRDIAEPREQDAFFAEATDAVFAAVTSGRVDPVALFAAVADAASDGRILLFSAHEAEQTVLAETTLVGSMPAPSEKFVGVYLNDATGAKMNFYQSVVAGVDCAPDGEAATHRATVTLTSSAPADAATTLSEYVTGGGVFGVVAGDIRTQVIVVLPVGATVDHASRGDDTLATVGRDDDGRTVVSMFVQVPPGEAITVTVDFSASGVDSIAGTPGVDIRHPVRGFGECERRR